MLAHLIKDLNHLWIFSTKKGLVHKMSSSRLASCRLKVLKMGGHGRDCVFVQKVTSTPESEEQVRVRCLSFSFGRCCCCLPLFIVSPEVVSDHEIAHIIRRVSLYHWSCVVGGSRCSSSVLQSPSFSHCFYLLQHSAINH